MKDRLGSISTVITVCVSSITLLACMPAGNIQQTIAVWISLGSSSFFIGFFIGLIFGTPYENRPGSPHTNLTSVSDWLSKILLGIALVEYRKIFDIISALSNRYGSAFLPGDAGALIVVSIIICFAFCGFFIGYSFTRHETLPETTSLNNKINKMSNYQNTNELATNLYLSFLNEMNVRGIYALSGSGTDVMLLITQSVLEAFEKGEIPPSYNGIAGSNYPDADSYLSQMAQNVIQLANAMADDAVAAGVTELHEWSLNKVKRRLCPLYPFLRQPCSQYDHLT